MVEADAVPHGGVLPQVARLCGNAVGSLLTVRDEAAVTRLWLFLATTAAYARHLRHGEPPCDACRKANAERHRALYRKRKT